MLPRPRLDTAQRDRGPGLVHNLEEDFLGIAVEAGRQPAPYMTNRSTPSLSFFTACLWAFGVID
jgi:hypothetical protein